MAMILRENLWLDSDCMLAHVNGENHEDDDRDLEIAKGLTELGSGLCPDFDKETEDGHTDFTARRCDCCGSTLAGSRYRFVVFA